MARKARSVHRCAECGAEHPKWAGRCDSCGSWNTLVEEVVTRATARAGRGSEVSGAIAPVLLADVAAHGPARWHTGLDEFDFVVGGGVVPGSVLLVGGEPGIGKSTLLLQCAARLEAAGLTTLYVSGEESVEQVRLRADRLEEDAGPVRVLPEVRLEAVTTQARLVDAKVIVVDSIQTTYTEELEGAPGNVGQLRECAARLMRFAKETGAAVVLVGHVTRGGIIAGPKTLEHVVDTVLYFEGEASGDFRILRAVKNRFGSVDEVGIFEMTAHGLSPVANPSAAFLAGRSAETAGSAVTALMEGTRPVLVEIQALAAKSGYWRRRVGMAHRSAWPPASISAGWPSSWRCWSGGRACRSTTSTCSSMSRVGCAWASRRVTSRSPPRCAPACGTTPFPGTRCSSARSASGAKCVPLGVWSGGSPKPSGSGSTLHTCPPRAGCAHPSPS
jgi:DNA repair protein RadA/Sms